MDQKKKDIEERILGKFVSNPALKMIVSSIKAMETPDFKLNQYVDGEFIEVGAELTQVLNPSLKQFESAQDLIVRQALEKFKKLRSDQLVVLVDFSNNLFGLDRNSLNQLSEDLAQIILEVAIKNENYEYRIETKDQFLTHKSFRRISIQNDLWYENWQPFGSFIVPYIDETWFAEVIRKKEEKVSKYKEKFDKKWLVLVANFGHQSSAFQFTNLTRDFAESPFDKIFIYKYHEDKIIELK